jgi:hypothetical protein
MPASNTAATPSLGWSRDLGNRPGVVDTMTPTENDRFPGGYGARRGRRRIGSPDSLSIALWIVGSCGAIFACAFGEPRQLILPPVAIELFAGLAQWAT